MTRRKPEIRRLLAAEYVLGSLRGPARRRFERLREEDAAFCDEADAWEARLSSLVDLLPGVEPPPKVWDKVKRQIRTETADHAVPLRLWDSANFWRGFALVSSAMAACLAVFMILTRAAPPAFVPTHLAVLDDLEQKPAWLLQLDSGQARYRVRTLAVQALPGDRSFELWLIPGDGRPVISMGLLPASGTRRSTLSSDLAAMLDPAHSFGVTLEPLGGSPTGRVTGALYATGATLLVP